MTKYEICYLLKNDDPNWEGSWETYCYAETLEEAKELLVRAKRIIAVGDTMVLEDGKYRIDKIAISENDDRGYHKRIVEA